jgi:hypothetical protein
VDDKEPGPGYEHPGLSLARILPFNRCDGEHLKRPGHEGVTLTSSESHIKTGTKSSSLRVVAAACMIIAGFCFMAGVYSLSVSEKGAANKDFISYWAAGHQLRHGANPYDGAEILRLERSVGLDGNTALIMRNPPVAFFLAFPLGFVSPKTGFILWSLVLLGGLSLANWIIWSLNGNPDSRLHLLGYLFAPALACQLAGYVSSYWSRTFPLLPQDLALSSRHRAGAMCLEATSFSAFLPDADPMVHVSLGVSHFRWIHRCVARS